MGWIEKTGRCVGTPARLLRLALSFWMIADMVFDGLQTKTYWDFAQATNNTFRSSMFNKSLEEVDATKDSVNCLYSVRIARNMTDMTPQEKHNVIDEIWDVLKSGNFTSGGNNRPSQPISIWYFVFAVVAWVLPPLFYMVSVNTLVDDGGDDFLFEMHTSKRSSWYRKCLTIPFDFQKAAIVTYIVIPSMSIILGLCELFRCKDINRLQAMPGLKLFEQFGEAIPQVTIATIFFVSNYEWLNSNDVVFDLDSLRSWSLINHTTYESHALPSITKTLLSIVLSIGSILIGVFKGINNWKASLAVVEDDEYDLEIVTTKCDHCGRS